MNKADILAEISRTAEANGGVPLGLRRFQSETGIARSVWKKIWAEWGDAIREAGLVPNRLCSAYDKTELLDKYARLALELGRLPTESHLALKSRTDSEFPSEKAFRRLGRKSELVRQVLEYSRNHKEYEDVVGWCEEYVPRNREVTDKAAHGEEEIGFVYLIKSGRFYKIGRTNAAGRREYELAMQLPEKTKTIHLIRTDDPSGIETYWHKRFAAKRRKGEWFALSAADVAAFKKRKFM